MRDEDARKAILARRARFIAAAMMGVGLASCEERCNPAICLKVAVPEQDASPMPCLSVPMTIVDAGASVSEVDAGDAAPPDAGASDAGPADAGAADGGAPPKRTPRPPPHPCLSQPLPSACLYYK